MSNYVEKNLTQGEIIVLKAKKSFLALIPHFLWLIITLVGVIWLTKFLSGTVSETAGAEGATSKVALILWGVWVLIGILPLLIGILQLVCMNLCITNKRVIGKVGVLRVNTLDYPIQKVDNVQMSAGFWGRIFRYSWISVRGGGSDPKEMKLKFKGISNAAQFKNTVTAAVEQHAQEARKAQAEEIARAMYGRQN
ncbi:MAG: PH domain-containing protein [Clostridia bacterium]|nr:PH domain-containing protein [Clostridia bacterium]